MIRPWPTIIIALLLLLPSPLVLFTILLAGDSCCGENTSAAMASFTITFVIITFMIGAGLHSLYKLIRPGKEKGYAVLRSSLLSTAPSALLYAAYLLFLTSQWIF
jgi:hypothetical protein